MNFLKSLTDALGFKKKEEAALEQVEGDTFNAPPPDKQGHKLSPEQQLQMVHMIAQGLTPSQIVEKMKEETGISLATPTVYQYRDAQKWQPKIKELREQYLNRLDLIDGSHKAVRIRRMEAVLDKAIKKGDLRVAISANEQTRKEFQSEEGTINVYWNNPTYQQFNQLSNEELLKKQKEATARLKIKKES